jgi:hypothetical protein
MTNPDIAQQRLYNQHISRQIFTQPYELVKYLGAVQAQDYGSAKWGLGLRLQNGRDETIEKAVAEGSIIRLHVLRPTWHFVSPADARWMLDLTAPRIYAASASQNRLLQLDSAIFKRSNDALAKALSGGGQLPRAELIGVLEKAGIKTSDQRFIHLLMRAELDKVICSGARQGKQFSYALFDDRVPAGTPLIKDEALAQLAKRYFVSRGPATLRDFSWWSGLAAADAARGLDIIKSELISVAANGREYWTGPGILPSNLKAPVAHLLPAFDEFAVAYNDRTAIVKPLYLNQARYIIFDPVIVVNNQVTGNWKRSINKSKIDITLAPFGKLTKSEIKSVDAASKRYRKFIR